MSSQSAPFKPCAGPSLGSPRGRAIAGDPAELDRLVAQGSMDEEAMREEFGGRLEPCEGDPVDATVRGQGELLRRLSL